MEIEPVFASQQHPMSIQMFLIIKKSIWPHVFLIQNAFQLLWQIQILIIWNTNLTIFQFAMSGTIIVFKHKYLYHLVHLDSFSLQYILTPLH